MLLRARRAALVAGAVWHPLPPRAVALQHMDRPLSMRDLAARLGCDTTNVTGLADRLEALGPAERRPKPSDRRVKQFSLAPIGAELRE